MKPELCILFYYAFNIASVAIPFAFIAFTIQRFCLLLYHTKHFFKTKRWIVLCIAGHWLAEFIISLPFVFRTTRKCTNVFWMTVYTLVTAVLLPSLVNFILNSMIFGHVRSSTRRVQPQNPSAWASRITTQQENRQQAPKISRREISLLRQMIFMFAVYTLVTAVVVPSLVNFILNSMIFGHVRSSTRRVQPQNPSAWASRITTQQENRQQAPKISRREISLLRQMIFMFAMFIGGWSPVFIVDIFLQLVNVNTMITAVTILFGEYVSNRALVYDENIRPNITRRNMAKPRWATVRRLSSVKEILT
ncbi:unnamed protein product [Adineta ricciae]|uniref:G-protein coupled receptors family 1 profile domain-containing protein n=1 Tax=Adineta ricciae TaxID=249248 RepID=A0A814SFT9_ADIRI|nr:unnamed protein product [Adineta ricciae]